MVRKEQKNNNNKDRNQEDRVKGVTQKGTSKRSSRHNDLTRVANEDCGIPKAPS